MSYPFFYIFPLRSEDINEVMCCSILFFLFSHGVGLPTSNFSFFCPRDYIPQLVPPQNFSSGDISSRFLGGTDCLSGEELVFYFDFHGTHWSVMALSRTFSNLLTLHSLDLFFQDSFFSQSCFYFLKLPAFVFAACSPLPVLTICVPLNRM